jgi:hypothetical protein
MLRVSGRENQSHNSIKHQFFGHALVASIELRTEVPDCLPNSIRSFVGGMNDVLGRDVHRAWIDHDVLRMSQLRLEFDDRLRAGRRRLVARAYASIWRVLFMFMLGTTLGSRFRSIEVRCTI